MIPRTVHTYSARRSGEMWQGECRTYRAGRLLSATDAGKPEWRRCDAVGTARIRANALALASGGPLSYGLPMRRKSDRSGRSWPIERNPPCSE